MAPVLQYFRALRVTLSLHAKKNEKSLETTHRAISKFVVVREMGSTGPITVHTQTVGQDGLQPGTTHIPGRTTQVII